MRKLLLGVLLMSLAITLTSVSSTASGASSDQRTCSTKPWYTHKKVHLGKRMVGHTGWVEGPLKLGFRKSRTLTSSVSHIDGNDSGASLGADFKGIQASFNAGHSSSEDISRAKSTTTGEWVMGQVKRHQRARIVVYHHYTMMKTFKKHNVYPCEIKVIYWTELKCPRRKIDVLYRAQCKKGGFGWCMKG